MRSFHEIPVHNTQISIREARVSVVLQYLPQVRVAIIGTARAVPRDYIRTDLASLW